MADVYTTYAARTEPMAERMETDRKDLARSKNVTKQAMGLAMLDSVTVRW